MAGRGTDIQLGGNPDMQLDNWIAEQEQKGKKPTQKQIDAQRKKLETTAEKDKITALESGGLYVIGTERHESRRIDNQLRGRSGRQGDPGASRFYISVDDDLMRLFATGAMEWVMSRGF